MSMLRLLAGLICPALLMGCAAIKDVEELKADIRDLKLRAGQRFLQYQPVCPSPGTKSNIECHYRLTITAIDKTTGKAMGTVAKDVIRDEANPDCEKDRKEGRIDHSFPCPEAEDYKYHVYEFEVDDPSKVEAKQTYNFLNVLRSHKLTLEPEIASIKQGT